MASNLSSVTNPTSTYQFFLLISLLLWRQLAQPSSHACSSTLHHKIYVKNNRFFLIQYLKCQLHFCIYEENTRTGASHFVYFNSLPISLSPCDVTASQSLLQYHQSIKSNCIVWCIKLSVRYPELISKKRILVGWGVHKIGAILIISAKIETCILILWIQAAWNFFLGI